MFRIAIRLGLKAPTPAAMMTHLASAVVRWSRRWSTVVALRDFGHLLAEVEHGLKGPVRPTVR